jgi:hypothetical protein
MINAWTRPRAFRPSSDSSEQYPWRPLILARRANDLHGERADEAVQFIDVSAPARAKAKVVQTDAILLEGATLHAWAPAR